MMSLDFPSNFKIDDELKLDKVKIDDAEELFKLVDQNRSHLSKWLPWVDKTKTLEDEIKFVSFMLQNWIDKKEFLYLIKE